MENVLPYLLFLACPIGMGLMMWFMMRGHQGQAANVPQPPAVSTAGGRADAGAGSDDDLAQLRAQLRDLEAQQAAIARRIEQSQVPETRLVAGTAETRDR